MSKFKARFDAQHMEGLQKLIEYILINNHKPTLEDQLHYASLNEVLTVIKRKLLDYKKEHKLNLTPVQALAMRLLFVNYIEANKDYKNSMYNTLLRINNEIHQQFLP